MSRLPFVLVTCCVLTLQGTLPAADEAAKALKPEIKPKTVTWAHVELKGSYPEGPQSPIALFGSTSERLAEAIARLDKAAADEEVAGLVLRINNPSLGWAKQYEFRRAIERVRAGGKKVYARLDSASSADYLVACACDRIIMPESGALLLTGLRAEVSFYKNLLDCLDVKADMLRVGEYKSAAEPFSRTGMSDAFREEMNAILDDYWRQMIAQIARGRKLSPKQIEAAIDSGPHTARAAKKLGLIDDVAYDDQIASFIADGRKNTRVQLARSYGKPKKSADASGMAAMMKLMSMLMGGSEKKSSSKGPKLAVIYAEGMIMPGKSTESFFGGRFLGSDTLVGAIREAAADENVKAVVLRVDSPGGSALASDLIWRALEKLKKPFVVSMGDVAASGGYYISMGADVIFAEPGTLTGSIGVVGGKLGLGGLFEKVGVTHTVLKRGRNATALSMLHGFTDSERSAMQKMLNEIYEQFTRKAAQGRNMEYNKLEKLARGRVYTGAMAQKLGLVDKLGTLDDAIAHARKLTGLKDDERIERLLLPEPTSPFESLFGRTEGQGDPLAQAHSALLQRSLQSLPPELTTHLQAVDTISLLSREPRLTLMPFRLRIK